MEKELSKLMGFRPEIKVVDATLRDGGLVNDFYFTDDFVKELYQTNVKAGVDYMEFGYKASKELFDVNKFGKWKFCNDEDIRAITGDNDTPLKIAVMADAGRCDFKNDILKKSDSPIDLIRVACYLHQIPAAIEMIEDAKNKGYEVSCNIMAISNVQESDLKVALDTIGKSPADVLYIVDSYGSICPEQMARLADIFLNVAAKYSKQVGIHAHDNQKLAFANTIECCGDGVNYLDATYASMGRGAGNCSMENLIGFLKNPKFNIYPVIKFLEEQMTDLKESCKWGYDWQYLLTGILNQHPRTAIAYTKDNRNDLTNFYKEITSES
ncbi:aldolase catalytic domain-containing protein [Treponema sp.]|uniref:aldolase catalytic domain-containing protein n=1 Tax=Treponema sp. TaxID=166 RepID=UPI0025D6C21F|nr:aldolase catalytic domain-containing protein [Treponema sp.]MCR5219170.1 aldolase catalytic domain-containing protein [Treponema sp.]